MKSGKDNSRQGEKSNIGYLAKYPWILARLSLDKLPSIQGYFFRPVSWQGRVVSMRGLFPLSSGMFLLCLLNSWTVSQNPYRVSWHLPGNRFCFWWCFTPSCGDAPSLPAGIVWDKKAGLLHQEPSRVMCAIVRRSESLVGLECQSRHTLTSSLKKHTFYNLLINNILYLCVT